MRLPKNLLSDTYRPPAVYLCQTNKDRIGELVVSDFGGTFKWNAYSEISFSIDRKYCDVNIGEVTINPYYDLVEGLRLVEVEGFGYFQLQDPEVESDGIKESKKINAYSSEYALSQRYLETFIINKGVAGSIDEVQLYNQNDKTRSLLHLIIAEKAPDWSIGHVDAKLATERRFFEIDRESVYDFIINEMCSTFKCIVEFNTYSNTINVYSEESSGEETDVMITFGNLANNIKVDYSADDIKTVLTVTGEDDLSIREVNFGLPHITDISYYHTVEWMGQHLYDAYNNYLNKLNEYKPEYMKAATELRRLYKDLSDLNNRVLGGVIKLNIKKIEELYPEIKNNVEVDKETGKIILKPGIIWEGKEPSQQVIDDYLRLRNSTHSMEVFLDFMIDLYKDNKVEPDMIQLLEDSFLYIDRDAWNPFKNKMLNQNIDVTQKESSIYNMLSIIWEDYGLNNLKIFEASYKEIQSSQVAQGMAELDNEDYYQYQVTFVLLTSVQSAMQRRQKSIDEIEAELAIVNETIARIAEAIAIKNNFTQDDIIRLAPFLREDEYNDANFVVTDIDTEEEVLETKTALLEAGYAELRKMSQPKLSFTTSIANIFALSEFDPIINQFQLGNMIQIELREDYVKKSRLLEVEIDFDDLSNFSVTFGDLLSVKDQADIHADLLSVAINAGKSVSKNGSAWQKGTNAANKLQDALNQGLLDAATEIKAMDATQSASIDKYGIHLRKMLKNGEYDQEQGWITSNKFLYTSDGWRTIKSLFGKFEYKGEQKFGVLAEALVGGYINGTEIEGGSLKIGQMEDGRYALVVNEDGTVQINSWGGELHDKIEHIEPTDYDAIISASTTPIFDADVKATTLTCTLYRNNTTVTPSGATYTWIRTSSDPTADASWNASHKKLTANTIMITTEDIERSAQFACEVNIP